jgi:hypothetical protein
MCVSPSILVFVLAYAKGHNKRKKAAKDKKESAALSSKGGEKKANRQVAPTSRGASGKKDGVAPVPTSPLRRSKKKKGKGRVTRKREWLQFPPVHSNGAG